MVKERRLEMTTTKTEYLHKAFKIDQKKIDRFVNRNNLLEMPPTKAIKKIWESNLSDSEVIYLIYTIGLAAGASASENEEDYDDEEFAGADPEEERCQKCGLFETYCTCDRDKEYIG
ncbi:MAG: hypothetical protein HYW25_02665 [Candidatus Aenigmarchaeota archaeon]|nr:hypothetical protein [Candidatus Aenigmarchaeota archaeon]